MLLLRWNCKILLAILQLTFCIKPEIFNFFKGTWWGLIYVLQRSYSSPFKLWETIRMRYFPHRVLNIFLPHYEYFYILALYYAPFKAKCRTTLWNTTWSTDLGMRWRKLLTSYKTDAASISGQQNFTQKYPCQQCLKMRDKDSAILLPVTVMAHYQEPLGNLSRAWVECANSCRILSPHSWIVISFWSRDTLTKSSRDAES